MPFTPLHMGPGLLIKSALRGGFSLLVFGWAQIVMDIQPLLVMLTGKGELHGITHTWLGATVLALLAAPSGKYLGAFGLRLIRHPEFLPIGWGAAFVSAFIGTWSHVLLDAIMHADLIPGWPMGGGNALHGWISMEALHVVCLVSAALGTAAWFAVDAWRGRRRSGPGHPPGSPRG